MDIYGKNKMNEKIKKQTVELSTVKTKNKRNK